MKFTGVKLSGVTVGYEPEYAALLAYARSQSIPLPDDAQKRRDNLGIRYAKAQGIWSEADVWYKMRSNGSYHVDFACLNWKNPGTFTLQRFNSPTFGADGFTGNGTNMYLDSGWNPSTNGVKFTQNNCSHVSMITTNTGGGLSYSCWRTSPDFSSISISPRSTIDIQTAHINSPVQLSGSSYLSGLNSYVIDRNSSTVRFYRNGSLSNTFTQTSRSRPAFNMALLAGNGAGTIQSFSHHTLSFLSFNSLMSSIDRVDIHNYLNTYVA
jgi:hypothetical protein